VDVVTHGDEFEESPRHDTSLEQPREQPAAVLTAKQSPAVGGSAPGLFQFSGLAERPLVRSWAAVVGLIGLTSVAFVFRLSFGQGC
jgi:hypothetical protein